MIPGLNIEQLPSGGVLVRNPSTGIWGEQDRWHLEEELRIGAVEGTGPDVFGEVTALEVDELRRVYVLDSQAREVRVFASTGDHLRTFGRRGPGPGELQRPVALIWGPEAHLWILDGSNRRWEVFDTAGAHVMSRGRSATYLMMPWPGRFDTMGNMIEIIDPGTITRYAPDAEADTFDLALDPPEVFELRTESSRVSANIPFAPRALWHVDREGLLWFGTGATYSVVRRRFTGDTVRVVERDYNPARVAAPERAQALLGLEWAVNEGIEVDPSRIPATKPAYVAFFTDDEEHLWVATSYSYENEIPMYGHFDVFDPVGRYLGEVSSPVGLIPFVAPVVRDGYMYGVALSDFQVMAVVKLRVTGRQ